MYILYLIVQTHTHKRESSLFFSFSHLKPSWELSVSQNRRQLVGLSMRTRVEWHCLLKVETHTEKAGRDIHRELSSLRFLASPQACVPVTALQHLPHAHCHHATLCFVLHVLSFPLLATRPFVFCLWCSLQCVPCLSTKIVTLQVMPVAHFLVAYR